MTDIYKSILRIDQIVDDMMMQQQTDLLLSGTDADFDKEIAAMLRDFDEKMTEKD